MTTPDEPRSADGLRSVDHVPRERVSDRVRNVDRDWSPERTRDRTASGPSRVLVPYDDSAPARFALESAFELFPDADVTALTIVSDSAIAYIPAPSDGPRDGAEGKLLEGVPRELEHAIEIAEGLDERVRTVGRVGSPVRGILEFLESESVDHVVIGSHCRSGIDRFLRGSVAEIVVRHSPVPVTVVPVPSNRGD